MGYFYSYGRDLGSAIEGLLDQVDFEEEEEEAGEGDGEAGQVEQVLTK
jgi:hypothetical protein